MTPVYVYSLLMSLLVILTEATDLSSLCDDILPRPASYRVQIMCDELTDFLHKLHRENELGYEWMPSTRISRDTSSAESALHKPEVLLGNLRVRRGGNYIRFGRSVSSPHSALTHSFGDRDKRSDGHYVRFGRSIPDSPHENNDIGDKHHEEKRFMRFGKRGDGEEKRFMRFGRDPLNDENKTDEEKRFMRFGKKDSGMADENKRFMRFGKREDDTDALKEQDEKRFMRFGRGGDNGMSAKRFMRFGKSVGLNEDSLDYETAGKRFMRFGKRTQDEVAKRFMRFGKRGDGEEEKRFMRFGKRFMRFGRDPQESIYSVNTPLESKDMLEGKRFMRFGKRFNEEDDLKNNMQVKDEEKRFMRFGKKSDGTASSFGSDKRFMRFGKRDESSS